MAKEKGVSKAQVSIAQKSVSCICARGLPAISESIFVMQTRPLQLLTPFHGESEGCHRYVNSDVVDLYGVWLTSERSRKTRLSTWMSSQPVRGCWTLRKSGQGRKYLASQLLCQVEVTSNASTLKGRPRNIDALLHEC